MFSFLEKKSLKKILVMWTMILNLFMKLFLRPIPSIHCRKQLQNIPFKNSGRGTSNFLFNFIFTKVQVYRKHKSEKDWNISRIA